MEVRCDQDITGNGSHLTQITKLNSYRILHDPIDEFTARLGVRVHCFQGSGITIPLFTNLMVDLHVDACTVHLYKIS